MTPGQHLKECRKAAPLTQYQLALALGVTQQLVSAWEADEVAIPPHRLADLAHYVGLDADWVRQQLTNQFTRGLG